MDVAKTFIQHSQLQFLKKLASRADYTETPIYKAINLAKDAKSEMGVYTQSLENIGWVE